MATWDDLKKHTWRELADTKFTYEDLLKKSPEELEQIAKAKLHELKKMPKPKTFEGSALGGSKTRTWRTAAFIKSVEKSIERAADMAKDSEWWVGVISKIDQAKDEAIELLQQLL